MLLLESYCLYLLTYQGARRPPRSFTRLTSVKRVCEVTAIGRFTRFMFVMISNWDREEAMFERWGRVVYRRRRLVLVIALIAVSFAAVWGTGVFGKLQSSGGFTPPNSQSQQSSNLAAAVFGRDAGDLVVLYSSPSLSAASPAYRTAVTHALAALPSSKVASYETYWSTKSPQFVSPGGRDTYAVLALKGADDGARQKSYDAIKNQLGAPGLRTQVGGTIPTNEAINKEVTSDIGRAEGFSMPGLLIVLLVIFGSLAAASLPLAIRGIPVLGPFTPPRPS